MSGSCGITGGRRRRHRSRKMKGGMGYGMTGNIGTAGAIYGASWGGEVTKAGTPIYDTADRPQAGSSRRRKSKKNRKGRRKTMRGGATWQTVGPVRAEFAGDGARGLANYSAGAAKVPPSSLVQNADGAFRA